MTACTCAHIWTGGEPPALYLDLRTSLSLHLCAYTQKCMQSITRNVLWIFPVPLTYAVCACKGRLARACPILDVTLSTRRNLNNGFIQMSTLIRHISPKWSCLTHCCNTARASSTVFKNNSILPWCTLHYRSYYLEVLMAWPIVPCGCVHFW